MWKRPELAGEFKSTRALCRALRRPLIRGWRTGLVVSLGALGGLLSGDSNVRGADVFDRHTAKEVQRGLEQGPSVPQLTLNESAKLKALSPTLSSPCLLVKTDDANYAKLLVAWGLRKAPPSAAGNPPPTPVLLIERFVTYRGDRPDLTTALGKDVMLFPGFGFNLDIGQVVPAGQGADLEFTADQTLKVLGEAVLVPLNGSLLPAPEKTGRQDPQASEAVVATDFEGAWLVDADGRWKGEWELTVSDNGRVTGTFVSEESQNRYEIAGQLGSSPHNLKAEIFLANTQLQIDAYLWTKDKSQFAGTVTMAGRKFGIRGMRQKP